MFHFYTCFIFYHFGQPAVQIPNLELDRPWFSIMINIRALKKMILDMAVVTY